MNKTLGRVFLPIALSFIVSFAHVGSASASEPWQQISPAGRITFSDLDLCANNQLLFRAGAQRGASSQDALFLTRLAPNLESASPALPIQQLTVFPEKMDMLGSGRILQIRNAFGAVRIFLPGGLPMPISGLPSFVSGYAHASWRSEEMASSADGRWLLYLDPVSPAFGNLVLLDVFSGRTIQIASGIERPERQFPASWSPDSRLFVYERAGVLYHYMIGSLLMPEDAQIRRIGEGTINSISWGIGGDFFYLRGSTLYHVRAAELFARALHAGFLNIGAPAGRIPFEFNPAFDNFWISPDARSLLVARGRRSLFYHPLRSDPAAAASLLPHLLFSRSWSSIDILWPADGAATVLVSLPNHAGAEMQVWRLRGGAAFDPLPLPAGSSLSASLSPNGQLALLWGDGGIFLYDYAAWQPLETLSSRPASAALWASNDDIITGDAERIERIRLSPPPSVAAAGRALISLSRAQQTGFEEGASRVLAMNANTWFVTDGRSPWTPIQNPRRREPSLASAQYRVFLERQAAGPYANLPLIRNIASVGTFPLFPRPPSSGVLRPGHNLLALTFALYDDDHGLYETLAALSRFGIRATFFLNGEFIRRHPDGVMAITAAGHESASMFFAPMDLSDSRFHIDRDFIVRGLARNEDEFHRVTGEELALLWRAPWHVASPAITAAAAQAGYATVGRDFDPLDWMNREDARRLGMPQLSPARMVDNIVAAARPGFIIPIRLGLLPDGRDDYLFNRINLLLDALIREGYTLTTVSTIIDYRARNQ